MRADLAIRTAVKVAALPFGAGRSRGPDDLVVLLYHRVGTGPGEIELTPGTFGRHLHHLATRERVRTLDDVVDRGGGGVVVTFDDGTPDFAEQVVPMLARYRLPAVLYLATGPVGTTQGVSWDQVRDAVATGLVTVGSHTHTHADLSRVDGGEAEDEMRTSKELIEDRLGVACRHFAYPWAVGSRSAQAVARRLFTSAALRAWSTNRAGRTDLHRLGRVPVLRADRRFFFVQKARGRLDAERLAYRLARRGPWGLG